MPTEDEIREFIAKDEKLLTPHDIAWMLDLERDTVRRKMASGKMEDAFKVDGQWHMTRQHFLEYLARGGKRKDESGS